MAWYAAETPLTLTLTLALTPTLTLTLTLTWYVAEKPGTTASNCTTS